MSRNKADRYQYQPWHIKLWRRRHYIRIPLMALKFYIADFSRGCHSALSLRNAWSIAIGLAQVKMNWLWDYAEIKAKNGWEDDND